MIYTYIVVYKNARGAIQSALVKGTDKWHIFYLYEKHYAAKIITIKCVGEYTVTV